MRLRVRLLLAALTLQPHPNTPYLSTMAKGKKGSGARSNQRTRINPLTGDKETVTGTKAGKKRQTLPYGHPLRSHDRQPRK